MAAELPPAQLPDVPQSGATAPGAAQVSTSAASGVHPSGRHALRHTDDVHVEGLRVDGVAVDGVHVMSAPVDPTPPVPVPIGPADIGAARDGDQSAFARIYRDVQPRLLRYATVLVGQDAEDVVAESWLQVARDLPRFSGDLLRFRAWTARIVRNRAIDHLRAQSRRPSRLTDLDSVADRAAPDDTAESAAESIATGAALALIATLPRNQAEAVLLRAVVGLDPVSAGKIMGKRPGAVRVAAHRGLRTLARRLEQTAATGAHAAAPLTDPHEGSQ